MRSKLSQSDSFFLSLLRSIALLVIIIGHTGGFTCFKPYSEFLRVVVPLFFFISGAVTWFSFLRSKGALDFYLKRIAGLLIPYYLLCGIIFVVFIVVSGRLPQFSARGLLEWVVISPANDAMLFPVGQLWFLKVLVQLVVAVPLLFYVRSRHRLILPIMVLLLIALSGVEQFITIEHFFKISYINLYLPLVYGSFFVFGIVYFSSGKAMLPTSALLMVAFFSLGTATALLCSLKLDLDMANHVFPPNLYYVSLSFFVLCMVLASRNLYSGALEKHRALRVIIAFIHRHTMSMFLLHTFARYCAFAILIHYFDPRSNLFWIVRSIVTCLLTVIIAVPFTRMYRLLGRMFLQWMKRVV